jgi:hypothetical protein
MLLHLCQIDTLLLLKSSGLLALLLPGCCAAAAAVLPAMHFYWLLEPAVQAAA